ncbi:unnamed protein product, partial [Amoebophrya sp. A120]
RAETGWLVQNLFSVPVHVRQIVLSWKPPEQNFAPSCLEVKFFGLVPTRSGLLRGSSFKAKEARQQKSGSNSKLR